MAKSGPANGETNAEYVTVIFRVLGIHEEWTQPEVGQWVSALAKERKELEDLVQLVKSRVVYNRSQWEKVGM